MNNMMIKDTTPTLDQTECRRCGTCCRKGGPALHIEDQHLVDSGKIPLKQLLTLRQGEPAYDNVSDRIAPAVTDIIRLTAIPGRSSECPFYIAKEKGCGIYSDRPVECNALKCWDITEIKAVYNTRRLTRRHLLAKVDGLWDLVENHQQRCDYGHVAELATRIRCQPDDQGSQAELLELIRYDQSIRDITVERSKMDPGILEFLFGRPLSFTIKLFQMALKKTPQGAILEPVSSPGDQVCYRRGGFSKQ